MATVSLSIQSRAGSVGEAVADNNRRSTAVTAAVIALGVAREDIQTSYFSLYPAYQFDSQGNPTGVVTYWVDSTLTVRLRQVDRLGELLKGSLEAGSTGVGGVSFGLANSSPDALKARQMAVADAQRKAEMLAGLAGAQLGRVQSIDTGGSVPVPYMVGIGGGGGGVPVAPGQTQVTQTVVVVYELR